MLSENELARAYGRHAYIANDRGSYGNECHYGCGCRQWKDRDEATHYDYPPGIDPEGECPGNPTNGEKLGDGRDRDIVVERRIWSLQQQFQEQAKRANDAEAKLKSQSTTLLRLISHTTDALELMAECVRPVGS